MQITDGVGGWGIAVALAGGAVRGSIPYMFVSLGECLTEKSGRINLGMEGVLLMGAMTAFGISDWTGSPWLGVIAAALVGALFGLLHAGLTELPRVNDVAAGIAIIVFGSGLAFFSANDLWRPWRRNFRCLTLAPGATIPPSIPPCASAHCSS